MKKLKNWSMTMLVVFVFPMMLACGGDDGDSIDRTETDTEKFYRLSGVKAEDYVSWKQDNFSSNAGTNYLVFSALRKYQDAKATNFHMWIFNKSTNNIVTHKSSIKTVETDSYSKLTYYLKTVNSYSVKIINTQVGVVIDVIFGYQVGTTSWGASSKCLWFSNNEQLTYIDESGIYTSEDVSSKILEWYNKSIAVSCKHKTAVIDSKSNIIMTLPYNVDEYVNPDLKKVIYYLETYDYDKGLGLHLDKDVSSGLYSNKPYYLEIRFFDFSKDTIFPYEVFKLKKSVTDPYDKTLEYSTEIISSDEVNCKVRLNKKVNQEISTVYTIDINKKEKTAKIVDN